MDTIHVIELISRILILHFNENSPIVKLIVHVELHIYQEIYDSRDGESHVEVWYPQLIGLVINEI